MRHVEDLSHKGKRSGKGLVDFQVGNGTGSVDLIECQVGRGDILDCQVGKGEEMTSVESSLIVKDKDRGSIMIIGGVKIFLPSDQGEASIDVVDAIEGQ